jgi:hypothetical protein
MEEKYQCADFLFSYPTKKGMRQILQIFSEMTQTNIHIYPYPTMSHIEIIKPLYCSEAYYTDESTILLLRVNPFLYGSLLPEETKRMKSVRVYQTYIINFRS